jgi:ADP-heptose:LPS heptosyltransferase
MKLINTRISINEFLNSNKLFLLFTHTFLLVFFSIARIFSKLFSSTGTNVLVVALHRLGDTIFTIPAVKEIQKKYDKKVVVVCFPESIPIYKLEFDDMKFCSVTREEFYFGQRIAKHSAKSKLRDLKPKIIFDITGSMISASLIFNTRAKEIVGTNANQFRTIYDKFVIFRQSPRLVDIYLDAISPLINISNTVRIKNEGATSNPDGQILIHPFAGWKEKEWNLKNYIHLASTLNQDYSVSLIFQAFEIHSDIFEEIENSGVEVIKSKSVEELIQQIKNCSMFIGNDSGPVNIANYLRKPTFTIYGSTNPDYTMIGSDYQLHILKSFKCSAQQNEKFCIIGGMLYSCSGVQCMKILKVNEVYESLIPLVNNFCKKKN